MREVGFVIKTERTRTAKHRFYVYTGRLNEIYRYSVCDNDLKQGEKTIGRFKTLHDAELFLSAVQQRYIDAEIAL